MDAKEVKPVFEALNLQAQAIDDQNLRAQEVDSLRMPDVGQEIFDASIDGIYQEQAETVDGLKQTVACAPYEDVYPSLEDKEAQLAEAQQRFEEFHKENEAAKLAIKSLAGRLAALSPRAAEKIKESAAKEIQRLDTESQTRLGHEVLKLAAKRDELSELANVASGAWHIPAVAYQHNIIEKLDETYDIDVIPDEPTLREDTTEEFIIFKERHIDAPDASQMVAFYLSENKNKIVGVSELADFLYNPEVHETYGENALRARVTTILGPKKQGKRIASILRQEGFGLQYGWRYTFEHGVSKDKQICRKRIYRASPFGELPNSEPQTIDINDSYYQTIKWTSRVKAKSPAIKLSDTPTEPKLHTDRVEKTESHDGREKTTTFYIAYILQELAGLAVDDVDLARIIYNQDLGDGLSANAGKYRRAINAVMNPNYSVSGGSVRGLLAAEGYELREDKRRTKRLSDGRFIVFRTYNAVPKVTKKLPNESDSTFKAEPAEAQLTDKKTLKKQQTAEKILRAKDRLNKLNKDEGLGLNEDQVQEIATQVVTESISHIKFRAAVVSSIDKLVNSEVIIDRNPVKITMVQVRSHSAVMGTPTAVQRLIDAKILSRGTTINDAITPEQVVAMDLFNTNKGFLTGPHKRKSMAVIGEYLDQFFGFEK